MTLQPAVKQQTIRPKPWPPSAWLRLNPCLHPKLAARSGYGRTTLLLGITGAACKPNGSTLPTAWVAAAPWACAMQALLLGCKPKATAHVGAAHVACPPCWPLFRNVKPEPCKALPRKSSVAQKINLGFQPSSQPSRAATPSNCRRPVPARFAAAPKKCHSNHASPSHVNVANKSKSAVMVWSFA